MNCIRIFQKKVSDNVFLFNARLAYNIGLGMIRMNLIVSYLNLNKQDIVDQLLATKQLRVQLTNEGHEVLQPKVLPVIDWVSDNAT